MQSEVQVTLRRSDVEVYVCSVRTSPAGFSRKSTEADQTEEKLLSERMLVASELWAAGISTEVMHADEGLTIEELQMVCRKMGYSWMVVLTDKFIRIAPALKVKSVTRKTEVDISRSALVDFLRKMLAAGGIQPESQQDVEQSSSPSTSATIPGGPTVNVNVLLDMAGQKKSDFKKKNTVIGKATEKFQGLRRQVAQQKVVEILAVDLPQAEMRTLISVDVQNDASFKIVTDQYPNFRKYLVHVRENMITLRKKSENDTFYMVLYSSRDEVAEYYLFWK